MDRPGWSSAFCEASAGARTRPRQLPDAKVYRLGEELLIYVPGLETAHALNRSAVAIWELCDGTRTIEDICGEIGDCLRRPGEELAADVRAGLARLEALGLLQAG